MIKVERGQGQAAIARVILFWSPRFSPPPPPFFSSSSCSSSNSALPDNRAFAFDSFPFAHRDRVGSIIFLCYSSLPDVFFFFDPFLVITFFGFLFAGVCLRFSPITCITGSISAPFLPLVNYGVLQLTCFLFSPFLCCAVVFYFFFSFFVFYLLLTELAGRVFARTNGSRTPTSPR